MTWMNAICVLGYVETWLFYSALSGFLILSLGALGVWFCKEPIYRIRITQWTFAACLFVPLIQITGLMPSFETQLSWPNSAAVSLADTPVQTSSNAVSDSIAADENSITSINSGNYSQPKMSTVAETFDVVGLRDADRKSSVSHVSNAVTSSAFKVRNILTLAWCVCAGFLAIQWVVGFALRRRIAARSRLATKDVHAALKTIAGEKASRVRLLSNEKIKSPVGIGSTNDRDSRCSPKRFNRLALGAGTRMASRGESGLSNSLTCGGHEAGLFLSAVLLVAQSGTDSQSGCFG